MASSARRRSSRDPNGRGRTSADPPDESADPVPDGAAATPTLRARGRGAASNPANRFEPLHLTIAAEEAERVANEHPDGVSLATCVHTDASRTAINYVDPRVSPDIGFRWTVNPYRGCEHGCTYCYARPTHEYLGYSGGLDFETQIVAKYDAPALLRAELASPRWKPEMVVMSGVTDPYQPLERRLRITRGCLEVFAECLHPVSIVTKNRLVVRDIDLLAPLAAVRACRVAISITTLDERLARTMEPRASAPRDRLRAVRELSSAGIEVAVMVAPIVPGLTDREVPQILEAARDNGASTARWILLRLPLCVRDLFLDFLRRSVPDRASHVEALLRDVRDGDLSDARPHTRMRGEGAFADQISRMFSVFARRYGLDRPLEPLSTASFRRPAPADGQLALFGA